MPRLAPIFLVRFRLIAIAIIALTLDVFAIKVDSVLNLYSLYGTDRTVLCAHFQTFKGSGKVGSNHVVSNRDPSDPQSGDGTFGWDVTAGDSIVLDAAYSGTAMRPFLAGTISIDANQGSFLDTMKFTKSMIDGPVNGGHNNVYKAGLLGGVGSTVTWKGWNSKVGPAGTTVLPTGFVLPADGGNLSYSGPALPRPPNNLTLPDTAINFAGYDWSKCPDISTPGLPGKGSKLHIAPGCYGKITINYLDTLIVDDGTYIVRDMSMLESGGTASLLANQPNGKRTLLICANSWKQGNGSAQLVKDSHGNDSMASATMNIGPMNDAMGQLMILYKGTQPMSIGTGTHITATISAPNAELNLKDQTALYGQAFAKRLFIRTNFNANLGQYIPYYDQPPKVTITQLSATVREPDTLANGKPDTVVAKFLLKMDHVNGLAVTVWYHTRMAGPVDSPGVALEGSDYVGILKGSVKIPVNGISDTIRVKVLGDVWYEGDRVFNVVIDSVWNGTIDSTTRVGVGTILENDLPPVFRIEDGSTTEGKPLKFRVHLVQVPSRGGLSVPSASARSVRFRWRVVPQNPSLIPDWDTATKIWRVDSLLSRTSDTVISIPTFADGIFQQAETLSVQIDWVFGASTLVDSGARVEATGIVIDADGPPVLYIDDTSAVEGNDTTGFLRARVRILSAATGKIAKLARPLSFAWTTSDNTAKDGRDYRRTSGSVSFSRIGATDTLLPVRILGDRRHDGSRVFRIALSGTVGASVSGTYARATGNDTIKDDDPAPSAVVQSIVHAGSVRDTVWRFRVTLSDSSRTTATFKWKTVDGTAKAGFDYRADSGIVVLRAQQTDTFVSVTIKGLTLWHADRSFTLALTPVADLSKATNGVGVIQSAVAAPTVLLRPGSVLEGRAGDTAILKIPFVLVDAAGNPTTSLDSASFDWNTVSGSAIDGRDPVFGLTDFVKVAGAHAVLASGRAGDTLRVKVIGNGLHQLDRTFQAVATPAWGLVAGSNANLTIRDDDAAPRIVVDSLIRTRDATKSVPYPFHVHLVGASGLDTVSGTPVSFSWSTRDGSATVSWGDYQKVSNQAEVLAPNTSQRTLTVTVEPDTRFAPDLDFFVDLAKLSGVTRSVNDSIGRGLIKIGVAPPFVRVTGSMVTEPKDGDTTALPFQVDLVDANGALVTTRQAIPFVWSTQDSTAKQPVDYIRVNGAQDTIQPYSNGTTVYVAIPGHSLHNVPLRYLKAVVAPKTGLFRPQGSVLTGVGTIRNTRAAPKATISSVTVAEPALGQVAMANFKVTLNEASALPARIRVSLEDSTAMAGTNFLLFGNGSRDTVVVVPPGSKMVTIPVRVVADDIFDTARLFRVRMSRVDADANPSTIPGIGRILNSDAPPTATITDTVRVRERKTGDNTAIFTVTLSRRSMFPIRIPYTSVDGTAKKGVNYESVAGTLSFVPRGSLNLDIPVSIHNDHVFSVVPLSFFVDLGASTDSVKIRSPRGTGLILEGNDAPELAGDTLNVPKRDSIAHFTLHLSAPLAQDDTVAYRTQDGTARDGRDYVATSGRLPLKAGDTVFQIAVHILKPANWYSTPRQFQLRLSGTDTVVIVTPSVPAIITDRDPLPAVDISDADTVLEGSDAIFRLTLPGASDDTIRVVLATRDGTAMAGTNFVGHASDTLAFLPDQTSLVYPVSTLEDSLFDTTLAFQARIKQVIGAVVGDSIGDGWIAESGPAPFAVWGRLRDTVREDIRPDTVWFPVTLSRKVAFPFALPVRLDTLSVPALNRARAVNFRLLDSVVRFPAATSSVGWGIKILRDGINTEPKSLPMVLRPARWVATGDDTVAVLVIRDVDALPTLGFVDSVVEIRQHDTTLQLGLSLHPGSGRTVDAPFSATGTARYGFEHLLRDGRTPSFLPGDTLRYLPVAIVDDHRYGPDRRLVIRLGVTESATLGRDSVVVLIRESSARPVLEFDTSRITVRDNAGYVTVGLSQSIVSDSVTLAKIRLDSASRRVKGVGLSPDTAIGVRVDTGAISFGFRFAIANDGKVGTDRVVRLHLGDLVAAYAGRDSVLEITILNTNLPPVVRIKSPSHKPAEPQDTLVGSHTQLVRWTLQQGHDLSYGPEVPQPDTVFSLQEGLNILGRSFTDTAGNTASDSVRVLADFTAPSVQVFEIVVPDPSDSTRSKHVPGKSVFTRFGLDTVRYWVRDSTKGVDGIWHVKVDSFKVAVDLHGDSTFRIPVSSCDQVGNCGYDTAVIRLKQSRPVIAFVDPSSGDTVASGTGPVTWTKTDNGEMATVRDLETFPKPGSHTITRCAVDSVGNKGCASIVVQVKPVQVQASWYYDTDGDGRIDAVIVDLDSKWLAGTLPSFDFKLGAETRQGLKPDSVHPFASTGSRGSLLRNSSGEVLRDAKGDTIWASVGQILFGADGKPRRVDGWPQTTVMGDTIRNADGKVLRDSLGRIRFRVPGPGSVDSSRLLVRIVPPFAYGVTSVDTGLTGTINATLLYHDVSGRDSARKVTEKFAVGDKVAPVILRSEVHRTESYTGFDTLVVAPSEGVKVSNAFVEILKEGRWVRVPMDDVNRDAEGRYLILLPPGDTASARPGYKVRFVDGVADILGNSVDASHRTWTITVEGEPRPPLVNVDLPKPVLRLSEEERDRKGPGGIVIRSSTSSSEATAASFEWWKPGAGYMPNGDAETRSICPDVAQCNGPVLYVNRPARIIVYVYDNSGTFVMRFDQAFSDQDLDPSNPNAMKPDKLDRYRIQLAWNHRDVRGDLVASGVYFWRIVSYVKERGYPNPIMTNNLYRIGVEIHRHDGLW